MATCIKLKMMLVGKKIKLLRAIKGLTQDELADKINKTRALVSHIEQTGKVNNYTLNAIIKALGISADDFEKFDGKNSLRPYNTVENEEAHILKERIEHYQKENKALKELIASQKKIIAILEKGKK